MLPMSIITNPEYYATPSRWSVGRPLFQACDQGLYEVPESNFCHIYRIEHKKFKFIVKGATSALGFSDYKGHRAVENGVP